MAYELTTAAAATGNPYAIVGAAIIDTARAAARDTTTQSGRGIQQNQLRAEDFSSYVMNAVGQMGRSGGARVSRADQVFTDALVKQSAGKYAVITAPTFTTDNSSTVKKRSVICTALVELGELHHIVHWAGHRHWETRHPRMVSGYYKWGVYVADLCRKYALVRRVCGFVARSRYLYIVFEQRNFTGWFTVAIGERFCYLIGDKNAVN